jgi:hypothetical protein
MTSITDAGLAIALRKLLNFERHDIGFGSSNKKFRY